MEINKKVKMYRFIDVLKNPQLVANIQEFFGVTYNEPLNLKKLTENETQEGSSMLRKKIISSPEELEDSRDDEESHKLNKTSLANDSKIESTDKSAGSREPKNYTIKNKFWFFFFLFGTYLGDDLGYAIFLPFWFWNVDSKIGSKIVLVWTLIMYIGQSIKDIVCIPRPQCPPVIRLQKKWSLEYGMPSTHAMVGIALPSSAVYYTNNRYKFPIEIGIIIALIWCILISLSRIYLGMHSLLDVLAGLFLSSILVIPFLPIMDYVGDNLITYYWYPLVIITISIIFILIYPSGKEITPTRGDTTNILATCVGIQMGFWLNYQVNLMHKPPSPPPFSFESIELFDLGIGVVRTLSGYLGIIISFLILEFVKKALDWILTRMKITVRDVRTKKRPLIIDMCYKYLTYSIVSFNVSCSLPFLFYYLQIHRSNYYWE